MSNLANLFVSKKQTDYVYPVKRATASMMVMCNKYRFCQWAYCLQHCIVFSTKTDCTDRLRCLSLS